MDKNELNATQDDDPYNLVRFYLAQGNNMLMP